MSLRKRSLASLLAVLILTVGSLVIILTKPTILGLDLQGGTEVILQAEATGDSEVTTDALKRAVNVINNRVNAFGVSEPEVQVQGSDKIRVALPGVEDQAQVDDLVRAAQLKIYAYEPNVVGRATPPAPSSPDNPTTDLYQLITFAQANASEGTPEVGSGPYVYLFRRDAARTFVAGPATTRDALETRLRTSPELADAYKQFTANPQAFEFRAVPDGLIILTLAQDGESYDDAVLCGEGGVCLLMRDNPGATGADLKSAVMGIGETGQAEVRMQYTGSGREKFAELTKELAQGGRAELSSEFWRFAVAVDDVVISTPTIDYNQYPNGIDSSDTRITGGFTESSARTLADQISSGALPIKLTKVSTAKVGAAYGNESLKSGLLAGAIGLLVVILGLILYYRFLGVIAAIVIVVYGLMLWAIAKIIPIALTLPGIAGTLLTVGVAADASVVIFERVREEIRAGRPAKTAVLSGYKRGITAIIDGNIVTLLTAVFIFLLATSGPRGFAFTLMIGVLLALFTAIILTPAALGLLVESKMFRNEKLMGLTSREPPWKMDVVGKWKFWIGLSFIPLVVGLVFVFSNGINQGIDFTGGSKQTITFAKSSPGESAIRGVVSDAGYGDARVVAIDQTIDGERITGYSIESRDLNSEAKARVLLERIDREFAATNGQVSQVEFTSVGPTFGRDIVRNAIWAILFSFLAIVVYLTLRFEWKLAIPALVSVVHDVWLSLTIYSIAGLEVTAATVAAFLTILGYSLYDVVIVFDRIRENETLMRGRRYRDIVNRSVHETLTRSIITMVSTLLPVIVLFLFGGETLKDFSFALLIGILSGGVSSIFISAPLAALWKEHEPDQQKMARREERKRARLDAVDADIVDVGALREAEKSMTTEPRAASGGSVGLIDGPEPEPPDGPEPDEPEPDEPDPDEPEPTDTARPTTTGSNGSSGRRRRHRNVQRRRR